MQSEFSKAYDFRGQTIVITGGAGVLGGSMARALAGCGAQVVIMDYNLSAAQVMVARGSM